MDDDQIKYHLDKAASSQKREVTLSDLVDYLFVEPFQNPISAPFIIAILLIFTLSIWPKLPFGKVLSRNAVSTLPSIGILGTFIGVLITISQFELSPEGMQRSLSNIMAGLKVAFSTSVYGLATSIFIRYRVSSAADSPVEAGPDEILKAINKGNADARDHNSSMITAIAGESDGSLNNQLRLMRQDLNDFAKTVAEANTTAFIDALKKAIADFNQNLTDQFGENFKKLNEAVGKLLEWQENNKKDMELLRDTLNQFVDAAKSTSESIKEIEIATASIPENVSGLSDLLKKLDTQVDDMEQRLVAFAEVADKASNAVPEIKNILTEYTEGLRVSLDDILAQIKEIVVSQETGFEGLSKRYEEIADKIKSAGDTIEEKFGQAASELSDAAARANQAIVETSNQVIEQNKNAADQYEQLIQEATNDIKDSIKNAIEAATSDIAQASTHANEQLSQIISEASQNASRVLQTQSESLDELKDQLNGAVQDFRSDLSSQINRSLEEQNTAISDFGERLSNSYEGANSKLEKLVNDYFAEMQTGVDETLDREMQELAVRLGAISKRIAEHYGPLTDNIRAIVELGKDAKLNDKAKTGKN